LTHFVSLARLEYGTDGADSEVVRGEQLTEHAWIFAAQVDAIGDGKPVVARAWGDEVAVYRVGTDYFANSNFCTHAISRLSDGHLDGFVLECPLHQALFDIRTGRCTGGLETPDLVSYEVRVRDSVIEIRQRDA
jgi:nitrite reductase/ring-hydroxylating ferredoxin subunit